ncbi:MAG: hypothetical protein HY938_07030 [Nitrosomonadales bacterium]|nr:hypothetical protein [Nitrosomonadales bacterium]
MFTLLGVILAVMAVSAVHSFLVVTEPVPAGVLVVEGWAPDYVLEEARVEFERHHYRRLYVTGGPLETGGHLSEYKTYAELGVATLVRMGMSKDVVEAVSTPFVRQDRTYTSALALKSRLHQQALHETGINLMSLGVHSRRSHLLFQKVFDEDLRVGIIAIEDRGYDPGRWWKFSAGVRTVVDEFVAYIYVLVVFPFV